MNFRIVRYFHRKKSYSMRFSKYFTLNCSSFISSHFRTLFLIFSFKLQLFHPFPLSYPSRNTLRILMVLSIKDIENIMWKGENADYQHFLLFKHFSFSKSFFIRVVNKPWFLRVFSTSLFETLWGKGEIARSEQFLLFPQCFLPVWRTFCHFSSKLKLSSANSSSLEESKVCRLGKS